MSVQDNTEEVLRDIHVLISRSEPYPRDTSKILVDKEELLDLLDQLAVCMDDMLEAYELTKESRSQAEREFRKQTEAIAAETSKKAEDVYAASMMYTDEALNRVLGIMKEASASVSKVYTEMQKQLAQEERDVRSNQTELQSQLQDLKDTEKYMSLMEERNKEIEREKKKEKAKNRRESTVYISRQAEIRMNQEALEKLGFGPQKDIPESEEEEVEEEAPAKKEAPVVRVDERFIPHHAEREKAERKVEPRKLAVSEKPSILKKPEAPKDDKEFADSVRKIIKSSELYGSSRESIYAAESDEDIAEEVVNEIAEETAQKESDAKNTESGEGTSLYVNEEFAAVFEADEGSSNVRPSRQPRLTAKEQEKLWKQTAAELDKNTEDPKSVWEVSEDSEDDLITIDLDSEDIKDTEKKPKRRFW